MTELSGAKFLDDTYLRKHILMLKVGDKSVQEYLTAVAGIIGELMLNILVDAIMCQSSESHLPSDQSLPLSCSSIFPLISLSSPWSPAWGGVTHWVRPEAWLGTHNHNKVTVQKIKADLSLS